MKLTTPKAIIFDWDNTLVDTWPIIHAALESTFTQLGLEPWTIETVRARVGKSMRDSFPEIFGQDWEEAAELYQKEYRSRHLDLLTPLPGAEELLKSISSAAIPAVVVSNKKGENLRTEVGHLGWGDYFTSCVGAMDAERDKPFPEPVHMALEKTSYPAGPDVWFIGDSDIDLLTASATGCTPILFGPHAGVHPEFTGTHYMGHPYSYYAADHVSLGELLGNVSGDKKRSRNG